MSSSISVSIMTSVDRCDAYTFCGYELLANVEMKSFTEASDGVV